MTHLENPPIPFASSNEPYFNPSTLATFSKSNSLGNKKQTDNNIAIHSSEELLDDNTTIASPTSMWGQTNSRRSSFSAISFTSYPSTPNTPILAEQQQQHSRPSRCKSLPIFDRDIHTLYPTKQTAYDRIEYLENQIRLQHQNNSAILKSMSCKINLFLETRSTTKYDIFREDQESASPKTTSLSHSNSSSTDKEEEKKDNSNLDCEMGPVVVVDVLKDMIEIVNKYSSEPSQDQDLNDKIFYSTQIIEKWVSSVTSHGESSAKQDLKNVVAPQTYDSDPAEKLRNERLKKSIQRLNSSKREELRQQKKEFANKISQLNHIHIGQKRELKNKLKRELENSKEEAIEMDQLLDEVRKELETVLEELEQEKQQRNLYFEKSKRLEQNIRSITYLQQQLNSSNASPEALGLETLLQESEKQISQLESECKALEHRIERLVHSSNKELLDHSNRLKSTHALQVSALVSEKEDLRKRLVKAEKNTATAVATATAAVKQISPTKENQEMEIALRRSIAEKDGKLAILTSELERTKRHAEQIKESNEQRMRVELNTRMEDLHQKLEKQFRHESDTNQVQVTREIRTLSGRMVELEAEIEQLERQQRQTELNTNRTASSAKSELEILRENQSVWETTEKELLMKATLLDQRVIGLEAEVLTLVSKNMELAYQLGELVDL